jgi:hypothetical protein
VAFPGFFVLVKEILRLNWYLFFFFFGGIGCQKFVLYFLRYFFVVGKFHVEKTTSAGKRTVYLEEP